MDLLRIHTDERIDVPDARAAWADLPVSEHRRIARELLAGKFNAVPATSETTTRVTLPITNIDSVEGVWLATDVGRTGTNYFTGGSFSARTGGVRLTLATALPAAATAVIVDFTAGRALGRFFKLKATPVASSAITVEIGSAQAAENLLARLGQDVWQAGQLVGGEGQASRGFDFAGREIGTYAICVQFTYTEGTAENRAFADALLDAEETRTVNTRWISGWNVVVRLIDEALGTIDQPTGLVPVGICHWDGAQVVQGDLTYEMVDSLFEGSRILDPDTSDYYRPLDFSRGDDRALSGVASWRQWANAVMRVLEELKHYSIDGSRWYTRPQFSLANATDGVTIGDGVNQRGHYNTSSYGGDLGLTIQAAFGDALPSLTRKRVKILPGEYTLTTKATINAGTMRGLTLVGSGRRATKINVAAALAGPAIDVTGTWSDASWLGIEFGDLTIEKLNTTDARILSIASNSSSRVYKVSIRDADFLAASGTSSGLAMVSLASDPASAQDVSQVEIQRCRFACESGATLTTALSIAAAGGAALAGGHVVVRDCEFRRLGRGLSAVRLRDLVVDGCFFEFINGGGVSDFAVKLDACVDARVSNSLFSDIVGGGVWSIGTGNQTIIGNTFRFVSGGIAAVSIDGGQPYTIVSGNVFIGTGSSHARIQVSSLTHFTLSGNVLDALSGATGPCINLLGGCVHFAVAGNTLGGQNGGNGLLVVDGAAEKFTITGNVLRLAGTDTIGIDIDAAALRGVVDDNVVYQADGTTLGIIVRPGSVVDPGLSGDVFTTQAKSLRVLDAASIAIWIDIPGNRATMQDS